MNNQKFITTFVCTGNTCRSPMAEGLFNANLPENLKSKVSANSRGLAVNIGDSVSQHSVTVMQNFGVDISNHKATPLSKTDLVDTNLFVCMTSSHADFLLSLGVLSDRILTLNISDPFGCTVDVYQTCAMEIKSKLWSVYEFITQSI